MLRQKNFVFLFCPVGMSVFFLVFVDLSIFVIKFSLKTLQELLLDFGQNFKGQEINFDCILLNEKFQINQTWPCINWNILLNELAQAIMRAVMDRHFHYWFPHKFCEALNIEISNAHRAQSNRTFRNFTHLGFWFDKCFHGWSHNCFRSF